MAVPAGQELDLKHSKELRVGDYVYITFGFNHAGYWKFGGDEAFQVIEKSGDGKIRLKAEDGTIVPEPAEPPIGGTKEELLAKMRELSNFKEVRVIRPTPGGPTPPVPSGEAPSIFPVVPVMGLIGIVGLAYYLTRNEDGE